MIKVKRTLLYILICLPLLLTGCEPAPQYAAPNLTYVGAIPVLTVQKQQMGEGEKVIIFSSSDGGRRQWDKRAELRAKVVALCSVPTEDRKFRMVCEDGLVLEYDLETSKSAKFAEHIKKAKFLGACLIGEKIHAVSYDGKLLTYYILEDKIWVKQDATLKTLGAPARVKIISFGDAPMLLWRNSAGSHVEKGLFSATLVDGQWQQKSLTPAQPQAGFYDAITFDKKLLLVRDDPYELGDSETALLCDIFDGTKWTKFSSLSLPTMSAMHTCLGMAAATDGEKIIVARASMGGVNIKLKDPGSRGEWNSFDLLDENVNSDWVRLFSMFGLAFLLFIFAIYQWKRAPILLGGNRNKDREDAAARFIAITNSALPAQPMIRAISMTLDSILIIPLPFAFFYSAYDIPHTEIGIVELGMMMMVWLIGLSVYSMICEGCWGQTVGKRVMGIRVRSALGGPASFMQVVVRNFIRPIDFFPVNIFGFSMPYLVAMVCVFTTKRRQRLGDIIAKTVVLGHTPIGKREIILASSSPRRKELMEGLGLEFTCESPDVNERIRQDEPPQIHVVRLAQEKASVVVKKTKRGEIIIAADTIICLEDEIIGKPKDDEDAREILKKLSGKCHQVLTAVAIIDSATGHCISTCEVTDVEFRELEDTEIDAYVASGEPADKAGAYAIQGAGKHFVENIYGSYSNVVGLPVDLLVRLLKELD